MVNVEGLKVVEENENAELLRRLEELKAKFAELSEKKEVNGVAKNKRAVKADPNRKYVLLSKTMEQWGRVPLQQSDIARILSRTMVVDQEYSEAEVFRALEDYRCEFPSLMKSVQHVTYLFAYYRGLKNDGKHAGYIARNFLRQIG